MKNDRAVNKNEEVLPEVIPFSTVIDDGMYRKGYRYRLTPLNAPFEPLYAKTIDGVCNTMRDWPTIRFNVFTLDPKECETHD